MTPEDIWVPSDKLLLADSAAKSKVDSPTEGAPVGGDVDDDAANEAAAAVVLAEAHGDDIGPAEGFDGTASDDYEIEDLDPQ